MRGRSHILAIHPAIAVAYGCLAIVLTMAFIQPALSLIAFLSMTAFGSLVLGLRSFAKHLLWLAPIVVAIALLNCLFVQRGATVLLRIGGFGLHGESLAYGLCMGIALVTAMEAIALLGEVVEGDEVISWLGRWLPSSALLASMALRLIPRMRRDLTERRDAIKACTALPRNEGKSKEAAQEVAIMVSNAMEDSLVTADSMRSRGYGSSNARTHYECRSFAMADGAALALVLILGSIAFAAGIGASAGFSFYPSMSGGADWLECVAFAAFFLMPLGAYLVGWLRWHRAKGVV